MQDYPLTLHHILWRVERLFARKQVATKSAGGVHRYTYGEMAGRVKRLANALRRLGVKEGDRVATLAWNNYRHLELYYAVPCMGAVLHTLNLRLSPDQLAFIANDAGDSVIVVDETLRPLLDKFVDRVPSVRRVIVLNDEYEWLLAAEEPDFAWPELDERAAAAMCYTSGTTGHPKGVVYTHRSTFLHTMAILQTTVMAVDEHDTILPMVPMFHANAWGLPYAAGMAGANFVFPDRWMGDADAILELAQSERATILAGVPTIWVGVLQKLGERALPDVRQIICGGSAVPRSLIEAYEARGMTLLQAWGMTEMSPLGSISRARSWHGERAMDARATQGPPVPCVEWRIADLATGAELPWDGEAFGEEAPTEIFGEIDHGDRVLEEVRHKQPRLAAREHAGRRGHAIRPAANRDDVLDLRHLLGNAVRLGRDILQHLDVERFRGVLGADTHVLEVRVGLVLGEDCDGFAVGERGRREREGSQDGCDAQRLHVSLPFCCPGGPPGYCLKNSITGFPRPDVEPDGEQDDDAGDQRLP